MRSEPELEPIAVAIASADPLVRAALAANLREYAELEVVREVAEADVVVWDPGLDAAEVASDGGAAARQRELAAFGVPAAVLVISPEHAGAALAAGARAVLARDVTPGALAAALVAIHRGLTVLDEGQRAQVVEPLPFVTGASDAHAAAAHGEELTARELEVMQLLAAGMSNKAIAKKLAISEHTAKFHVNSILNKLGVSSRTEAVVIAARRALVIL